MIIIETCHTSTLRLAKPSILTILMPLSLTVLRPIWGS